MASLTNNPLQGDHQDNSTSIPTVPASSLVYVSEHQHHVNQDASNNCKHDQNNHQIAPTKDDSTLPTADKPELQHLHSGSNTLNFTKMKSVAASNTKGQASQVAAFHVLEENIAQSSDCLPSKSSYDSSPVSTESPYPAIVSTIQRSNRINGKKDDMVYLDMRRRNNESARKSRAKKRALEVATKKEVEEARQQLRDVTGVLDLLMVNLAQSDPRSLYYFHGKYETLRKQHFPNSQALRPINYYRHFMEANPVSSNNLVVNDEGLQIPHIPDPTNPSVQQSKVFLDLDSGNRHHHVYNQQAANQSVMQQGQSPQYVSTAPPTAIASNMIRSPPHTSHTASDVPPYHMLQINKDNYQMAPPQAQ